MSLDFVEGFRAYGLVGVLGFGFWVLGLVEGSGFRVWLRV